MKISGNLDKLSWTVLDKVLFIIFAIVILKLIMSSMSMPDWGIFSQLIFINTFVYVIIDSLALQSVIQYGQDEKTAPFVNTVSMFLLLGIASIASILSFGLKEQVAILMEEDRFVTILSLLPMMIFSMIPRFFSIKFMYRDLQYKHLFITNLSYFGAITLAVITIKSNNWSNLTILTQDIEVFDINSIFEVYFYSALFSSLVGFLLTFKNWKFSLSKSVSVKQIINFNTPIAISSILHSLPKTLDTSIINYVVGGTEGANVASLYSGAKILMRGFEDLTSAIYGIIYPLSRKYIARGELENAKILITKAISYMLIFFITCSILLYTGLFDSIIYSILPPKYRLESNLIDIIISFKILVLSGVALPFTTIAGIINADDKPKVVAQYTAVAVAISIIAFYLLGFLGFTQLIPFGLVLFYFSISCSYIVYSSKNYKIRFKDYFRAFPDIIHFIKNKIRL